MDFVSELLTVFGLTLLNGVFAGSEIAMLAVRKTRLKELADGGQRSAAVALRLRQDTECLLATVQVGVTVVGAATAVFGGMRFAEPLTEALIGWGVGEYAPQIAFALVVSALSYLSLVLGELVPKSLALQRSERFALISARGLFWLSKVARPVVWLLTKSSNLVLWPLRDRTSFSETRLSSEELRQLVEEAAKSGSLNAEVADIASRAIDFGSLAVHALMVPRTRMVSLPESATRGEILRIMRQDRHTRYPITGSTDDDIAGYVVARDVLERMAQYPHAVEIDLLALARELPTCREQAPAIDVLRRLQHGRTPFAVVIDEHGSTAGIVTVEDLAEELLGEIREEDEDDSSPLRRESEYVLLVRGDMPLQELGRELSLDLEPRPGATTVAGLVIQTAGRIPKVGERFAIFPRLEAEVTDATIRQVRGVRLHLTPVRTSDEPKAD